MNQHHEPITPDHVAAADLMHTRGRNLFDALVRDYRAHRDTCDAADCHIRNHGEEIAVAKIAAEMWEGMFRCGHQDCMETNLQTVCEALSYAGVRTAEGRPLDA